MSWLRTQVKIVKFELKKKMWVEKERTLTSCVVSQCLHLTEMRLQSKVAVRWLPNTADFFFSLARLIEDLERRLSSASYDSLQYYPYFGALMKRKDTPSCNTVVKFTLWVQWSNRKGAIILYIITGHTSIYQSKIPEWNHVLTKEEIPLIPLSAWCWCRCFAVQ